MSLCGRTNWLQKYTYYGICNVKFPLHQAQLFLALLVRFSVLPGSLSSLSRRRYSSERTISEIAWHSRNLHMLSLKLVIDIRSPISPIPSRITNPNLYSIYFPGLVPPATDPSSFFFSNPLKPVDIIRQIPNQRSKQIRPILPTESLLWIECNRSCRKNDRNEALNCAFPGNGTGAVFRIVRRIRATPSVATAAVIYHDDAAN